MNKITVLKITNVALFVSVAAQIVTGAAMLLGNIMVKLGLFGPMFRIHKYNGFLFIALAAAHLYQNRGWIKANILKQNRQNDR